MAAAARMHQQVGVARRPPSARGATGFLLTDPVSDARSRASVSPEVLRPPGPWAKHVRTRARLRRARQPALRRPAPADARVVATLLDEGRYLCTERTMARRLAANQPVRELAPISAVLRPGYPKPELVATLPWTRSWSWDITRLRPPKQLDVLLPLCLARHLPAARRRGLDRLAATPEATRRATRAPCRGNAVSAPHRKLSSEVLMPALRTAERTMSDQLHSSTPSGRPAAQTRPLILAAPRISVDDILCSLRCSDSKRENHRRPEVSLNSSLARLRSHYRRHRLLPGVLCALVALRIWDPLPVAALRLQAFDLYQRVAPRESSALPALIVDIDDPSLAEVGQWPWPRSIPTRLDQPTRHFHSGAVVVEFRRDNSRTGPHVLEKSLPRNCRASTSRRARFYDDCRTTTPPSPPC